MPWWLFLDDERFPVDAELDRYEIARTVEEAIELVHQLGCPERISFDNDLGSGMKEGYDFAKWLVESSLDGGIMIPDNFQWYTHSQNPRAKENIDNLLKNFLERR